MNISFPSGETTTGGRRELVDPKGMLDYDALMLLTLQRARTAREAIKVVDELAREYGYKSSGETFSIADPNEAWIMELIGKGPDQKGIVWVAARVPDGMITAHANLSRITTFPLDDPENWLYSPDVISFAIEKKFYSTDSQKPFSYRDAYHPGIGPSQQRACAGRVWSIYRRSATSQEFSDAFFRGKEGAEDYPLFIKPDKPLGVSDVMALMRDHYEGTPYDMTKGLDAGPFGTPYRYRDLPFKVDGAAYMWERPISTQQAGFVTVSQSRKGMPDGVGGVTWFTPDDASTSCFTPFYCGITALPAPYLKGDYKKFEWDSAWWVSNLVSNLCYDRWSRIAPDVQAAQVQARGRPAQDAAGDRGSRREAGLDGSGLDARVPDQLFGLDRRGGLPQLAGGGRVDPDQACRRLCEECPGTSEGSRLLSGMAQARRRRPARTVQGPDEVERDRSLRTVCPRARQDRARGRIREIERIQTARPNRESPCLEDEFDGRLSALWQ